MPVLSGALADGIRQVTHRTDRRRQRLPERI
jgi:hypothetical protein